MGVIIDYLLLPFTLLSIALFYLSIYFFSTHDYDEYLEIFSFILKEVDVIGANENLIDKSKYFFFFVTIICFVCFFDTTVNRVNYCQIKNAFNENKPFSFFNKDRYTIDGINRGTFGEFCGSE